MGIPRLNRPIHLSNAAITAMRLVNFHHINLRIDKIVKCIYVSKPSITRHLPQSAKPRLYNTRFLDPFRQFWYTPSSTINLVISKPFWRGSATVPADHYLAYYYQRRGWFRLQTSNSGLYAVCLLYWNPGRISVCIMISSISLYSKVISFLRAPILTSWYNTVSSLLLFFHWTYLIPALRRGQENLYDL